MVKYGIDVSYHQGEIDWNKVKNSGKADFVILRAGIGLKKDVRFEEYYANCKKLGIPVGAYWYSYATTGAKAIQEATCFLDAVKGKQFEYPLFFDIEESNQFSTGIANCSYVARTFCEALEKAGYYVGIYASKSHLEDYLTAEVRERFAVWVAHYGVGQTSYSGQFGMWQKSDTGRIDGISGDVDLDECYIDYPEIIQGRGFNGFEKAEAITPIVVEVEPEDVPEMKRKRAIEIVIKLDGEIVKSDTVEIDC
ncbi:MAG: glycoside hydrolase family 25 protein [Oscillospiraceae bacterium]